MAAARPPSRRSSGGGLNRKLGPLPLWAWGAIGIAGIFAGLWLRNRLASSTQQSVSSATPTDVPTAGTTFPDLGGATSGGGGTAGGMAPNEFADFAALLGALQSGGFLGGQATGQLSPAQAQPFTIQEPTINVPAPLVTYLTNTTTDKGPKTLTSAKTNATSPPAAGSAVVSPVVQEASANYNYAATVSLPDTGPPAPAGRGATAAQYQAFAATGAQPHPTVVEQIAAARPGGVSANKKQGVYSIH